MTVSLTIEKRDDGGLRIWSDDLPGLVLSGADPMEVWRDLGLSLKMLLRLHHGF